MSEITVLKDGKVRLTIQDVFIITRLLQKSCYYILYFNPDFGGKVV
ncbi:MAG: hypothetical protein IPH36_16650 [Saprospiraceae bacterium]|nr:hypothetical protein [Saprospiraceae bacterium]